MGRLAPTRNGMVALDDSGKTKRLKRIIGLLEEQRTSDACIERLARRLGWSEEVNTPPWSWVEDFVERLEGEAIGAASKIVDLEDEVATLKQGNRDYARMIAEFEERSKPVADRGKVTQH